MEWTSLIRVLALLALLWVDGSLEEGGSQQGRERQIVPVPADLMHPSELPALAEDSFERLLEHGRNMARYGQNFAIYARPACEASPVDVPFSPRYGDQFAFCKSAA